MNDSPARLSRFAIWTVLPRLARTQQFFKHHPANVCLRRQRCSRNGIVSLYPRVALSSLESSLPLRFLAILCGNHDRTSQANTDCYAGCSEATRQRAMRLLRREFRRRLLTGIAGNSQAMAVHRLHYLGGNKGVCAAIAYQLSAPTTPLVLPSKPAHEIRTTDRPGVAGPRHFVMPCLNHQCFVISFQRLTNCPLLTIFIWNGPSLASRQALPVQLFQLLRAMLFVNILIFAPFSRKTSARSLPAFCYRFQVSMPMR